MKHDTRMLRSALAAALATIFVLSFSACENRDEKPEKSVDSSDMSEDIRSGEGASEAVIDSDDAFTYSVKEFYSARDGLNIYGKLYVPENGESKMPAVILSHSANLNADSMNLYAAGFAERGYIAYAFDFCGSGSNSRSDGSTDDMTLFSEIDDLKAALSAVSSMDNIDKDRIYLFGTSQGGLVTALAAEECEADIKGEILLYPAFNIPELAEMASKWSGLAGLSGMSGFFGGGYGQAFTDTLKDYDVYAHIGAFSKKVLIIHGASDFIVNKSYSEKAAERYSDCTLKIIDGAGHGFNNENYAMGGNFDDRVWESIDEYLGNP